MLRKSQPYFQHYVKKIEVWTKKWFNCLNCLICSTVKLFAEDPLLFSIVHDAETSAYKLSKNLQKVFDWVYQQKMQFNLDLNKQTQEVIFSRKITKPSCPLLYFNAPVSCVSFQKHLEVYIGKKLNFSYYIKKKMSKTMKGIGVIKI